MRLHINFKPLFPACGREGAGVKKVKLTYKGDGHMSIDSGRINLKNSLGTLTEQQPIEYANAQPVKVKYRHQNNEVSFDVENADQLINKNHGYRPNHYLGFIFSNK